MKGNPRYGGNYLILMIAHPSQTSSWESLRVACSVVLVRTRQSSMTSTGTLVCLCLRYSSVELGHAA